MPAATRPRIVPDAYVLLSNWRYVEHSLLRIIAGWGRAAGDWEDKLAVCEHVWLQAEIVDRMRRRLGMFPGGRPDGPVNAVLERAMNAVIEAPSFADAMAAVHGQVQHALTRTYKRYIATTHPVHDRPTHMLLAEVLAIKAQQAAWYASFHQRHPRKMEAGYAARVEKCLAEAGDFAAVIEPDTDHARPCGKHTSFRMSQTPGRVKDWDKAPDIMPMLQADWSHNPEARRLFFMIGYCWEMGVAEEQLRWIYHADFMPWEYTYAEARHMWDEARHGDSGYHRLRDFGLDFEHFGYSSYGRRGEALLEPMSPREVYEGFYGVTQIAETGYFATKRYSFEDMLVGGDDPSAEMFQYDIIDETSHVEYGHQWLPEMAQRCGVDEDYRERGKVDRVKAQAASDGRVSVYRQLRDAGRADASLQWPVAMGRELETTLRRQAGESLLNPRAVAHYRWLLQHVREQCPLRHADRMAVRPNLPM